MNRDTFIFRKERELCYNIFMIYITGDPHAKFDNVREFCKVHETSREDIMIVLGDIAVNSSTEERNRQKKEELSQIPVTFFCIHGNHDRRPGTISSYSLSEWRGGKVWKEEDFPNILFAKDAEEFDFDGTKAVVIGGAYSPNKEARIKAGKRWFADEQPSEEIKQEFEAKLKELNWKVDVVLSHTVPLKYKPADLFQAEEGKGAAASESSGNKQETIDESTEEWLDMIEEKLDYQWWYAGHFHTERTVDKVQIMFKNIEPFEVTK